MTARMVRKDARRWQNFSTGELFVQLQDKLYWPPFERKYFAWESAITELNIAELDLDLQSRCSSGWMHGEKNSASGVQSFDKSRISMRWYGNGCGSSPCDEENSIIESYVAVHELEHLVQIRMHVACVFLACEKHNL